MDGKCPCSSHPARLADAANASFVVSPGVAQVTSDAEEEPVSMINPEFIRLRRAFSLDHQLMRERYATLEEAGMMGDYVSPLQLTAASPTGPVLLAHHWSDLETARKHRVALEIDGYLRGIPFNNVIDKALEFCGRTRNDCYMTQAFHLLPRSPGLCHFIPSAHLDASFRAVTRHELQGRTVVALGRAAAAVCRRAGISVAKALPHPSARGRTVEDRAQELAGALQSLF